jgi:hypothetical protein
MRLPVIDAPAEGLSDIQPASFAYETNDFDAVAAEEDAGPESFTLDELRGEMKSLMWTKGDFKIIPYGALWGSAIYSTRRTAPGPYIVYVNSPTTEGESAFEIDTRRTRLGLDVTGPMVPLVGCSQSGAKVEIDFHGNQPPFTVVPVSPNENRALPLLRHAYA